MDEAMRLRLDTAGGLRAVADPLHRSVVRPRLEVLRGQMVGVSVDQLLLGSALTSVALRLESERFPATGRLSLSVAWSDETSQVWLVSEQAFVPVLLPLDLTARSRVDPSRPDPGAVAAWVEDRILEFVDACHEVEGCPAYRGAQRHLDPVCRMIVAAGPAVYVLKHGGRDFYFCTATCQARFAADPSAFLDERQHAPQRTRTI
jgi:YHS domain-containing protein